jgi:hypothetical protein
MLSTNFQLPKNKNNKIKNMRILGEFFVVDTFLHHLFEKKLHGRLQIL